MQTAGELHCDEVTSASFPLRIFIHRYGYIFRTTRSFPLLLYSRTVGDDEFFNHHRVKAKILPVLFTYSSSFVYTESRVERPKVHLPGSFCTIRPLPSSILQPTRVLAADGAAEAESSKSQRLFFLL